MDASLRNDLLTLQRGEITEQQIYQHLARRLKDANNRTILERMAAEEQRHYSILRRHTGVEVAPQRWRVWLYCSLALLFGLTFTLKHMERGEDRARRRYESLAAQIPEATEIALDEKNHERQVLDLLDEERLRYTGSIVLGLNDALVELTGVLAGLTLALQNTRLIALTGLITGISAALSMACSEYLSTKNDPGQEGQPRTAALYTGCAYIVTVILLVAPFFLLGHYLLCLLASLLMAIAIIAGFNYYLCVAQDLDFTARFREMVTLSLGVAVLSFVLGYLARLVLGVNL
ncbi:MAG: VIT1/CCC1 transporter family protein [Desulfuromonas sp.]|uniref:VIT1/CCC1 transporter family protein n=1 Tax=Desulfuromonas thiophila TaxID=57664 RepID=UPI0029F5900D|nr:VIT1/CCC1 transporter family protein [Desulfuromonas thiophila]